MHEICGSETTRRAPAQLIFLQIPKSSGSQITKVCELGLTSEVNTQVTGTWVKKQNMSCASKDPSILLLRHHRPPSDF